MRKLQRMETQESTRTERQESFTNGGETTLLSTPNCLRPPQRCWKSVFQHFDIPLLNSRVVAELERSPILHEQSRKYGSPASPAASSARPSTKLELAWLSSQGKAAASSSLYIAWYIGMDSCPASPQGIRTLGACS